MTLVRLWEDDVRTITPLCMDKLNYLIKALKKRVLIAGLAFLMTLLLLITAHAQDYGKLNRRHQHSYYRKNESRLARACHILDKKRHHIPRRSFLASHKKPKANAVASRSELSIQKSEVTADVAATKPVVKPVAKPVTKPLPIKPKIEQISATKLEALHKKEDEVLASNKLPVPTSKKHEEVRNRIADRLANKVDVFPLVLEPLYFQFNQDEFSVVDMEPFLVAAEYALQGRTILIEGHTDTRGQDDFNVKLSIKRVQKIRQLMLDMGVPDDRISVVGYGEELNKAKNKNEKEHQNSRRVDFTIF
jgi:outer membrane protein OmpA-like peptidoglycan-associated protein